MLSNHPFATAITFLALLLASCSAQRPSNASVCDYYAEALYGANNSDTQQRLVQKIVCLAFEGGTNLTNVSSDITGILRPGQFDGVAVDLLPWFNGSKASSNVNNEAIGINWLDDGGTAPLAAFLTDVTDTVVLTNGSNQYHLFGNFFVAFSRAFGCTLPVPALPNSGGPLSLAYVHKFMNLDFNDLSHFIQQLTSATEHYGFSTQDGETLSTHLNSLYNVRCAPAVTFSAAQGPQLLSLCQNPTCPLAAPVSDCAAYVNLTASGVPSSNPTTVVSTASASGTASSSTSTSSSSASASASTTSAAATSKPLSTGGIAGVAIGGSAVLLFAALGLVFIFRKRRRTPPPTPAPESYSSPTLYSPGPNGGKEPHMSYYSTAQPPSEMDNSRYQSPGGLTPRVGSPEMATPAGQQQQWGRPVDMSNAPVEMEGGGHGGYPFQRDSVPPHPGVYEGT